jgi:hypothetical protein
LPSAAGSTPNPEEIEKFFREKNLHNDTRAEGLRHEAHANLNRRKVMLWTIFVILLVLWLLGLVSGYTLGGFIYILLVLAIIVLIINLVSGRRGL